MTTSTANPQTVTAFWREAGSEAWFKKDDDFVRDLCMVLV
jgi:uncharacterized protein (DUF924 family)